MAKMIPLMAKTEPLCFIVAKTLFEEGKTFGFYAEKPESNRGYLEASSTKELGKRILNFMSQEGNFTTPLLKDPDKGRVYDTHHGLIRHVHLTEEEFLEIKQSYVSARNSFYQKNKK